MYSIGQVSELFDIPVSTLRYYDKEGLFPRLERSNGIRRFGEQELELLRIIDCLKKTGLEIKDIKRFVEMVQEGPSTYGERRELFEARKVQAEQEIERMQKALAMVEFKCWYYETAQKDGGEERLWEMIPDGLPKDIRKLYDLAHS
ncbi:MerR family transcriptional regulator [uncultured Ellagibacter sp.]|uniref:MerR family transcriptional regulator n=1 Tax=uncultured Ellagibacter sp. TaxID=2137580 RepID=UPI002622F184|nr:MerR family transcriptional regulator [uncultured Ellagibacter sp.]